MRFSKSDPYRVSHLFRAQMYKNNSDIEKSTLAAIAAAAHYFHALFPSRSPKVYASILWIDMIDRVEVKDSIEKYEVLLKILDPVIAMTRIWGFDLPISVQLMEPSLPVIEIPAFTYYNSLDRFIYPLLSNSGETFVPLEEQGKVIEFFKRNPEVIDDEELLWEILKPSKEEVIWYEGGKLILKDKPIERPLVDYSDMAIASALKTFD